MATQLPLAAAPSRSGTRRASGTSIAIADLVGERRGHRSQGLSSSGVTVNKPRPTGWSENQRPRLEVICIARDQHDRIALRWFLSPTASDLGRSRL
jgi:hypothetical protein